MKTIFSTNLRFDWKLVTITVVSTEGAAWRVAPTFIKKVSGEGGGEPEGKLGAKVQGELIELAERQQRDRGKA